MRPRTQVLSSECVHSGKLFCPLPTAVKVSVSSPDGKTPYRDSSAEPLTIRQPSQRQGWGQGEEDSIV